MPHKAVAKLAAVIVVVVAGCGARQASDGESDLLLGEPDWSECVSQGDLETCADVCAAQGMECVPDGCPVDPEFCNPKPCDMATQALAIGEGQFCADASVGTFVSAGCDAPIEWLLSNTLRCCCAEEQI